MKSNRKSQVTDKLHASKDVSAWLLLGTNIATIIWAQVAAWELGTIMWVYWSQCMFIGVLWFFKILTLRKSSIKAEGTVEFYRVNDQVVVLTKGQRKMLAAFFLLFYGFFHVWYGIFLTMDFGAKDLWSIILMSAVFVWYQAYSFFYNRKWEQECNLNIGRMIFFPLLRIAPMYMFFMVDVLWTERQTGSFHVRAGMLLFMILKTVAEARYYLGRYFEFYNDQRLHQALGYCIPAEVYGVAVGTPVALRAPSVPTAVIDSDESTLKTPVFCLDNG